MLRSRAWSWSSTWLIGTLDNPATDVGGWVYNAKNIMFPMNTAYREAPGAAFTAHINSLGYIVATRRRKTGNGAAS